MRDIREMIVEYVEREYQLPEGIDYDAFDLVENGYIDSMSLVVFVSLLEEEYDVEFTSEELLSKDFRTIGGLERLIHSKKGSLGACCYRENQTRRAI